MNRLYYNPIEPPEKIRVKSSCSNIDVEYFPWDSNGLPIYMDQLFDLAKSKDYETVQVYLTSHNEAYVKKSKKDFVGVRTSGWIDLEEYGNGGGYHKDGCLIYLKGEYHN